ncbi:MAG: carboxypeptidase regulatory-like domain-containing protein [Vicinamibacterales bacterium]
MLTAFASTPRAALARQEAVAGIIGQVSDQSRAVLPGVTITVSSDALQVAQTTTITDERGEYRLSPLPIGTYTVVYELTGFRTHRVEGVRLTVGFTAKLDVALVLSSIDESVVVSGASPVVDVTTSSTNVQLTRETLELTPTGRFGYISLMAQAAGVRPNFDIGGSALADGGSGLPQFRAFGQSSESWQTVEGVVTTTAKTTQGGNFIDYSGLEETRVQTVGADAEMPTRGIRIDAIYKSGSNQFHGGAWWSQTNQRFQSNNLDEGLIAQGVRSSGKLLNRLDVSGDFGGPVVTDKLWFYTGVNYGLDSNEVLNVFKPDGSPASIYQKQTFINGKVSYQASRSDRIIAFMQGDVIRRITASLNINNPWETRVNQPGYNLTPKLEWQRTFGDSVVVSAQQGFWNWDSTYYAVELKPATTDVFTMRNTGSDWQRHLERRNEYNNHTKVSASWYKSNFLGGNHEFKAGLDYLAATLHVDRASRGEVLDYRLVFNNGTPFQITTSNDPLNAAVLARYLGTYARDSWAVNRRLTLNLGLRFAHDNGFVPKECREAGVFSVAECYPKTQFKIWKSLAPRVHFAYQATADGKTAIKGGWARFDHRRLIDPEMVQASRNLPVGTVFTWRDLNGNRLFEPGESNLDPRGPDFVAIQARSVNLSSVSQSVPNPDERQPKQDEFSLSVERQLVANTAVRVTGIYSRGYNNYRLRNNFRPYESYNIPVTRPDPGPDGRAGTADDTGQNFTYFEYPANLQGAQFIQGMLVNDPDNDKSYKSFELAAFRRLSSGWQFSASYSATYMDEPVPGTQPDDNPNAELNTALKAWEWIGRASGAYMLPWNLMASMNFEHRSGDLWQRNVLFTGGRTITSLQVNVEPVGTRRLPNTNVTDLRLEKRFHLGGSRSVTARMNFFNLMNVNTVRAITSRSGPTFGQPTGIVRPRIMDFSASLAF